MPDTNFKLPCAKLRDTAEPNTPLPVPEIGYLRPRLLSPILRVDSGRDGLLVLEF